MDMSISDIESKIRGAVADAKARGWLIRQKEYVVYHRRECCVLAACVIDEVRSTAFSDGGIRHLAAKRLGISENDALRIVLGFDNGEAAPLRDGRFVELGQRLRDLVDT